MKKKVAVAMSGGVDSTMAAWQLMKKYEVAGFFLKTKFAGCPNTKWKESEGRAFYAAKKLGIPLYIIDARDVFQKKVWDDFWDKKKKGLTPNPCPHCNPIIKFGFLRDKAKKLGFDYLATGHYARIKKEKNNCHLLRGKDKTKDQSYFLYRLNKNILPYVMFPMGEQLKKDIKAKAKKVLSEDFFKLDESQGICFAQGENYPALIKKILPQKKGKALDKKGNVLGEHQGFWFYTEGQRSGLGSVPSKTKPYYVLAKNKKNEVILTENIKDKGLYSKKLKVHNINWINKPKEKEFKAKVQIRYGAEAQNAQIKVGKKYTEIVFQNPQRAVTPGQSAVFYLKEEVLGGGEIL